MDAKALERGTFYKWLDSDVKSVVRILLGRIGVYKSIAETKVLLKGPLHIGVRDKSWYLRSHTEYATSQVPSVIV